MIASVKVPQTVNAAKLLHEEEVRYREALRMKANSETLKQILEKIELLKLQQEHEVTCSF